MNEIKPTLEELFQQSSHDVNLENGDHYCSLGNCFRKATIKMGFSYRCPIHRFHKKFCSCNECNEKRNPYLGSKFIKKNTK